MKREDSGKRQASKDQKMKQFAAVHSNVGNADLKATRTMRARGYTLVELLVVLVIAATMTAVAAPVIQGALSNIRLTSAVQSTTSAISTTRYQALRYGYPFQLKLNSTTLTYQVLSEPVGAAAFANVGSAIPISASNVALNANTTLQFNPSGTVQFISGAAGFSLDAQTFTIAFAGKTTTVTVSSVGYVTTSTQ
jgi:prepilin-type N-terminal cleavage/methylation domain-containing protein